MMLTTIKQRTLLALLLAFLMHPHGWSQGMLEPEVNGYLRQLTPSTIMPETILNGRSVVIYATDLSRKELADTHSSFRETGIDAVAYFETDRVFAGKEITSRFADYFVKREIANLVFLLKEDSTYRILLTAFTGNAKLVKAGQGAWEARSHDLKSLLQEVYRSAASTFAGKNRLINDVPETDLAVPVISGNRFDAFAYDMKVDPIAVPRFDDSLANKRLEELFKRFPFKYALVDPAADEKELRRQGYFYILQFVHAPGTIAKGLLGYQFSNAESAFASVTFQSEQPQLRNFPVKTPVYKFYVRMIDSGNIYLGTKWDADVTWDQALMNYILGLRWEFGIK